MAYETLKAAIRAAIYNNGNEEITGNVLQGVLLSIVNTVGFGATFGGVATPETNPGTPEHPVFWLGAKGNYTNFGTPTVEVRSGYLAVFQWDGSAFSRTVIKIGGSGGAFDVTDYTGNSYASVSEAAAAVPVAERAGGMSIKYVDSSDNKYVQFRCMADSFTTDVTKWQGVDEVPTAGSRNLVQSGGVRKFVGEKVGDNVIIDYSKNASYTNRIISISPSRLEFTNSTQYTICVIPIYELFDKVSAIKIQAFSNTRIGLSVSDDIPTSENPNVSLLYSTLVQAGNTLILNLNDYQSAEYLIIQTKYYNTLMVSTTTFIVEPIFALKEEMEQADEELESQIFELNDKLYEYKESNGKLITINGKGNYPAFLSSTANVSVVHCGKNILPKDYDSSDGTRSGITFTKNSDGSLHIQGTASANVSFYFVSDSNRKPLKAETYTISPVPVSGCNFCIGITGDAEYNNYNTKRTITIAEDNTYYFKLAIKSGSVVNTDVYPQIEVGENATQYAQPIEETILLNANESKRIPLYNGINNFISNNSINAKYAISTLGSKTEINLKTDCGAVGDGVQDDTIAINSALALAENGILYIPKGTYLFSGTLNIHTGTTIIGSGYDSVLQLADVFNLTEIPWRQYEGGRKPMLLFDANAEGCILRNFRLAGQTNAYVDEREDGILVRGKNHILENLCIQDINFFPDSFIPERQANTPGFGIYTYPANNVTISNCEVLRCQYEHIGTEDSNYIKIDGCTCVSACQTGIQIHRGSKNICIINNFIDANANSVSNWHNSLTLHALADNIMEHIYIVNNTINGNIATIGGSENYLQFMNNMCSGNVTMNAGGTNVYNQKVIFVGNYISGKAKLYADKLSFTSNMIDASNEPAIEAKGNKTVVSDNNLIGSAQRIDIIPHE